MLPLPRPRGEVELTSLRPKPRALDQPRGQPVPYSRSQGTLILFAAGGLVLCPAHGNACVLRRCYSVEWRWQCLPLRFPVRNPLPPLLHLIRAYIASRTPQSRPSVRSRIPQQDCHLCGGDGHRRVSPRPAGAQALDTAAPSSPIVDYLHKVHSP